MPDPLEALRRERAAGRTRASPDAETWADRRARGRRVLACAACAHPITSDAERIEVGGQHRHVQANPSGIVYEIGCFRTAPGCVGHGPSEAYWSWFPGYRWQTALCGDCHVHVGWSFHGEGGCFHGLVLARLVENGGDGSNGEGRC